MATYIYITWYSINKIYIHWSEKYDVIYALQVEEKSLQHTTAHFRLMLAWWDMSESMLSTDVAQRVWLKPFQQRHEISWPCRALLPFRHGSHRLAICSIFFVLAPWWCKISGAPTLHSWGDNVNFQRQKSTARQNLSEFTTCRTT